MKPPESKPGWDWINCDMEFTAIEDLVQRAGGVSYLLNLGDIYSLVREDLNNEVLKHLAEVHEHCTGCGAELLDAPDEEKHCPNCEPEHWTEAPDTYRVRIEGTSEEFEASTLTEAKEQAADLAGEGDYGEVTETLWIDWDLDVQTPDGWESVESGTVGIDPDEPECLEGKEHDWESPHDLVGGIAENPGVWGHGGGVVICEACMHCGAQRRTDTWAQRPDTGEQGLRSVSYQPIGYYELPESEEG